MKKDFIPRRNSNLFTMVQNFIDRLDIHSTELKLNRSDVTEAKNLLKKHLKSYQKMVSKRAEAKSVTEEFYIDKKNSVDMIRRLSKQIKTSLNYKTSIGEGFGIIDHYTPEKDFTEHKPVLKGTINGNEVILKYTKNSASGIYLFSKRGSENKFTELARISGTTYNDTRPKLSKKDPENREYYAIYYFKDKQVGKKSNVLKVTVS